MHVDARRVRVALDVGQRLLEDPAQLAQDQRRQRADVVERAADPGPGALAPARGLGADRGRQRQLGVVAAAQPADSSSRASCAAVRASAASLRASSTAPGGSTSIRRDSASAAKPMPCTVLASESCMSRASRSRSACAAMRALLLGQRVLGLGLAVEQAPRARPGDGDDRVQRRQHDQCAEVDQRRVELRADVDRVRVAHDQHHAEQRRARDSRRRARRAARCPSV